MWKLNYFIYFCTQWELKSDSVRRGFFILCFYQAASCHINAVIILRWTCLNLNSWQRQNFQVCVLKKRGKKRGASNVLLTERWSPQMYCWLKDDLKAAAVVLDLETLWSLLFLLWLSSEMFHLFDSALH